MPDNFYPCKGNIKVDCLIERDGSNIVVQEGRTRINFKNPVRKTLYKIRVDGCVIVNEGIKRCDYLLIYPRNGSFDEHFLELKGRSAGLSRLMEQLENSIKSLGCEEFKMRFAYAVFSNRAPSVTTAIQKFKHKFRKELQAYLLIKESKFEQNLENPLIT